MPEELYTSRDFCELAEQFEELKRENEELVSDKMHLINAAMDGVDKYRYTAHDIAYRDLERKCEALEADYVISNRELLIKQVEINRQSARIAELEAERRWIPVSERLPEDGESVLIAVDSAFAPYCHVYEAFHHSAATQWATANGLYFHGVEYARVTHWMPLPEPPEVK